MPATPSATPPMPLPPRPDDPRPGGHRPLPGGPPEGLSPVADDDDVLTASQLARRDAAAGPPTEEFIDAEVLPAARPGHLSGGELRRWQFGLIALLSKLECLRGQLAGCRYAPDADHLLARAEAMVQFTEEFAREHDFPDSSLDTQMATLAKAGAFYATLNDIRKPPTANRSLFISVFGKPTPDAPVPAVAVRECVQQAIEALHAHFSLFTEMYRSTLKARAWVDAASAFLADFKQMARETPEE